MSKLLFHGRVRSRRLAIILSQITTARLGVVIGLDSHFDAWLPSKTARKDGNDERWTGGIGSLCLHTSVYIILIARYILYHRTFHLDSTLHITIVTEVL